MLAYARLAAAGSFKIKADTAAVEIKRLILTATVTGTVTLTDGNVTYVIDVTVGVWEFCIPLTFTPAADITITAATATISVFAEYVLKA
jgi:hypothetical protein